MNLAGLDIDSGQWLASTFSLNSPSIGAIVADVAFTTSSRLVVLSVDPSKQLQRFHAGLNFFQGFSTYPDPSTVIWLGGFRHFVNIDITIEASAGTIAALVICTLVIIIAVASVILLVWRRNSKMIFRYIEIPDYMSHGVKSNWKAIMRDKDVVKLDAADVELGGIIGQGGQAVVRKAFYKGQTVAAKAIIDFSPENFGTFLKESKILASISHQNIVHMIGLLQKEEYLYLVTEMMDTDLLGILDQLDDAMKTQVTVDVASAMSYLHSFQPPVLHRDLKPSNILVSRDGRVKLSDFGVSRLLKTDSKMTRDAGTLLYMAPEVWSQDHGQKAEYGTASDVYSYGLLVIEVWTGKNPFHPAEFTWILEFLERMRQKIVVPGVDHMPPSCPQVIVDVTRAAVSWEASERPTFLEIVTTLTSSLSLEKLGLIVHKSPKHGSDSMNFGRSSSKSKKLSTSSNSSFNTKEKSTKSMKSLDNSNNDDI